MSERVLFINYRNNDTAKFSVDDAFVLDALSERDAEYVCWDLDPDPDEVPRTQLVLRVSEIRSAYVVTLDENQQIMAPPPAGFSRATG